jgi:hypothetical protein
MSIRYDLEIHGPVLFITIAERGRQGYLVGQSGGPLHGESLRTGYLDVPQAPQAVSVLFESPGSFELTVSFKDGSHLSARFSRTAAAD